MRCPGCDKFCSLTFEDPEIESGLDYDSGTVQAVVRIVRNSECCGDEMKEATFEFSQEVSGPALADHVNAEGVELEGHEIEVEHDDPDQLEEGGGRYAKSYFGVSINYRVRCACQDKGAPPLFEGTLEDKIAASHMDECC